MQQNDHQAIYNEFGKQIVPFEYEYIIPDDRISDNHYIFFRSYDREAETTKCYYVNKNNKWGVLDTAFNLIVPIEYESLTTSDLRAHLTVSKNYLWGMINSYTGELLIEIKYDLAPFDLEGGLMQTKLDEKFGLCDHYGNVILEPSISMIRDLKFLYPGIVIVNTYRGDFLIDYYGNMVEVDVEDYDDW